MMFRIFIGICAVLAIAMIVLGGVEYMTSELVSSKESGKHKITGALLGLLLALGSYAILNTINPDLLNSEPNIPAVAVQVDLGGEAVNTPFVAMNRSTLESLGILCGGSDLSAIARSFINRSNYTQSGRNTVGGGRANVDCSSFVSQVYACGGLPNPGGTTAGIFGSSGAERVTNISATGVAVNGEALRVGDLLGWRQGENGERWGHVVMYIGGGQVIDAQGGSGVGVRPLNSEQFRGRITYIRRQ